MTEHKHSHHHHHKMDGATRFKRKSLMAIERRKKFARFAWIALSTIAIILGIFVVVIYVLN